MQRYSEIIRDELGNAIADAEVRVFIGDSSALATVYDGDENVVAQPLTTDSNGLIVNGAAGTLAKIGFKATGGRYRLKIKKGTDEFELPDVLIGDTQGYDAIDFLSAASEDIFPSTSDGITATTDGDYFYTAAETGDNLLVLYKNDAGTALELGTIPRASVISNLVDQAEQYRDQIAAFGSFQADTTAGLAATSDGEIFSVANDPNSGEISVYRNDAGSATLLLTYIPAGPTIDAFLTTLGFTAFTKTLIDDADADAFLTTLGFTAFTKTLIDDADADAYWATLMASITKNTAREALQLHKNHGTLRKPDYTQPCITKTGAQTLSVLAGTSVQLDSGAIIVFDSDTAITMPTLTAGTDYSVWVNPDGSVSAHEETDYSSPTVIAAPTAGAQCIGGFHYGLVDPAETVAGGSFATTGTGWIWDQGDVDDIRGINKFSIWDLHFRVATNDMRGQRGFAFEPNLRKWSAIYFASSDTDANGLSRAGTNIASGTVPGKIPAARGGDGTTTYSASTRWDGYNWFACNEVAGTYGARLMRYSEAMSFFVGVTEAQSIGGASSTYPTTERNAGYTSRIGIEQASGHHYTWGLDAVMRLDKGTTGAWNAVTGGRGSIYTYGTGGEGFVNGIFGGFRANGSDSGSACAGWDFWPWYVNWRNGLRAAGDHLERVA